MLRWWNHQTHLWLKHYIQERLVNLGERPSFGVNMTVFLVSAIWHGFYPCYYFCFFFAALLSEVNKDLFKAKIIFRNIPNVLKPILANQACFLSMNYMGIVFCSCTWHNLYMFTSSTHYFVFIGLFLTLAYTRGTNLVGRAKKLEEKLKAKSL